MARLTGGQGHYDPQSNRAKGRWDMERRRWLLGALLVLAIAAGFGIGSAVKSTSAPARGGSLASRDPGGAAQATVTRPGAAVPVPPLRVKASATHTSTSTSGTSSAAASSTATTVATATQTFTTPVTTPTVVTPTTVTHTSSGGGGGGGGGGG